MLFLFIFSHLVSFFLLKLTRDYSKGRLYLVSPKFVKLGRFAGKEGLVLPMNCASSSSNHGMEYSSEMLQQQIEGDKDAVMIVDHGSRREESNLMLSKFIYLFIHIFNSLIKFQISSFWFVAWQKASKKKEKKQFRKNAVVQLQLWT